MRKMFLAAGILAATVVTGGFAAAPAGAAVPSDAGVRADGPGYCGPLHEDNTVPSKDRPRAESQPGRAERGNLAGNYCSGDAGNAKPAPRGETPPTG